MLLWLLQVVAFFVCFVARAWATTFGANKNSITVPEWTFEPTNQQDLCFTAVINDTFHDRRWVYTALPNGTSPHPSGKWPLYVHLVIDPLGPRNRNQTINDTQCAILPKYKPFLAFDTPDQTMATCYNFTNTTTQQHPYCNFNQESGAMWDQRLKQYLVANGVAVVAVNGYADDYWDSSPAWWAGFNSTKDGRLYGGRDRIFLPALLAEIAAGSFGPIDVNRTFFHGWSGGAQMVSQLFEVFARNGTQEFPGVRLAGGVMVSGGSYACYNSPSDGSPEEPFGTCATCLDGKENCSAPNTQCSSCNATLTSYCRVCCPRNFTEAYYQARWVGWLVGWLVGRCGSVVRA